LHIVLKPRVPFFLMPVSNLIMLLPYLPTQSGYSYFVSTVVTHVVGSDWSAHCVSEGQQLEVSVQEHVLHLITEFNPSLNMNVWPVAMVAFSCHMLAVSPEV